MAQLPPKIPNIAPTWPDFSHQNMNPMGIIACNAATTTAAANQNPSWVDEFLDFSSARRGTHRRSVSDSIAFLEAVPMLEECRGNINAGAPPPAGQGNGCSDFDKFDDEQFMSMFTDDGSNDGVAPSSSSPSTPSDDNSINDEKETTPLKQKQRVAKNETEEVKCQCESERQTPPNATNAGSSDRIIDPKRVKRILANRQSAQRSRVRKLQYISELERNITSLQAEVSVLSPKVAFLDHQRLLLNVDNSALKQRIAALAQDKIFKDAHQEALKREIERLRQVYHQQNLKTMESTTPSQTPIVDPTPAATEEEQQQLLQV